MLRMQVAEGGVVGTFKIHEKTHPWKFYNILFEDNHGIDKKFAKE